MDGLASTHEQMIAITKQISNAVQDINGEQNTPACVAGIAQGMCDAVSFERQEGIMPTIGEKGFEGQIGRTNPDGSLTHAAGVTSAPACLVSDVVVDGGAAIPNVGREAPLSVNMPNTRHKHFLEYAKQLNLSSGGLNNVNHRSMILLKDTEAHDEQPWWVANPQGSITIAWGLIVAVCVLYTCWYIPFSIGFGWWRKSKHLYYAHYLLEVIFWADMVQSFRTGFVAHGKVHTDPKHIAKHYLHLWFWVDLLANVPWESIAEGLVTDKKQRKSFKMMKWAKLPKLLRTARLRKLLDGMGGIGQYTRVLTASFCFFFFAHLISCTLISFTHMCEEYPPGNLVWKYLDDVDEEQVRQDKELGIQCTQDLLSMVYSKALHVGMALVLGNYLPVEGVLGLSPPNVQPERDVGFFVLATIGQILGVFMLGILLAQIARLILVRNWHQTQLWMQWDVIKHEMSQYGDRLPVSLQHRIRKYFQQRFRRADYGSLSMLDSEVLTKSSCLDVAFSLYGPVLRRNAAFHYLPLTLVRDVSSFLSGKCYTEKEYIYRVGEEAMGLLILERGTVEIQDHSGRVLQTFRDSGIFGETVSLAQLISERHGLARQHEHGQIRLAIAQHNVTPGDFLTVDVARTMSECFVLQLALKDLRTCCAKHHVLFDKLLEGSELQEGMGSSGLSTPTQDDPTMIQENPTATPVIQIQKQPHGSIQL